MGLIITIIICLCIGAVVAVLCDPFDGEEFMIIAAVAGIVSFGVACLFGWFARADDTEASPQSAVVAEAEVVVERVLEEEEVGGSTPLAPFHQRFEFGYNGNFGGEK